MTIAAETARRTTLHALSNAVAMLSPVEYRDVLEELQADIDGRLDALDEEGSIAEDE